MPKYPVTANYRGNKIDMVVYAEDPGEAMLQARSRAMTLFSIGTDDCGMDINIHVKLPLKEGK